MRDSPFVQETAANRALQSGANDHPQEREFLGDQIPRAVRNSVMAHSSCPIIHFPPGEKQNSWHQQQNRQTHHASQIRNHYQSSSLHSSRAGRHRHGHR
jgi:hypothetical protein